MCEEEEEKGGGEINHEPHDDTNKNNGSIRCDSGRFLLYIPLATRSPGDSPSRNPTPEGRAWIPKENNEEKKKRKKKNGDGRVQRLDFISFVFFSTFLLFIDWPA